MRNKMIYGKTKGIVLLKKYLPDLYPFQDIDIVGSIEEWNQVKEKYGEILNQRGDTALGDSRKVKIDTDGYASSVPRLIKEIKAQNPDGVLLCMKPKDGAIPRYEDDGGFNILFNMNDSIIIELVGKGFDGHELTRVGMHERYQIPWDEVLFVRDKSDLTKNKMVQTYLIEQEAYKKTRENRIEFLKGQYPDCDPSIIEENVPEEYNPVSDEIVKSILDDVILKLMEQKSSLSMDGLRRFGVQGNFIRGKVQPWEIFRAERMVTRSEDLERDK